MRKRILLAEESDTTRGVAETVLRQNGFEVISVPDGDKALEVLEFSRPDLLVVGSTLTDSGGKPLYQRIQEGSRTSGVPMLLFAPSGGHDLPFPDEVIVACPFDPKDFLDRVTVFSGQTGSAKQTQANPLQAVSLDDELLDAALGLDRIEVTDSEVIDKTKQTSVKRRRPSNKAVGFAGGRHDSDGADEGRKVESIMIRDDQTDIRRPKTEKTPAADPSETGGLEILPDQYGLSDPSELAPGGEEQVHDYEWFINEMQRDHAPTASAPPATDSDLKIEDNASAVAPSSPVETPPPATGKSGEGVEKFIDEFKREMERVRSDEPETVTLKAESSKQPERPHDTSWEETLEHVTPADVQAFTDQLASQLADKIAQKIVDKIDADKLLHLIKSEIVARVKSPG